MGETDINMIIVWLVMYFICSYAMGKIGKKFAIGTMALYFIPVYNLVLTCRCAGVSPWWVLGLFVPVINIAVIVYIYGSLAERLGKNFWLNGIGSLILCIPLFIMAWDGSRPVKQLEQPGLPQEGTAGA